MKKIVDYLNRSFCLSLVLISLGIPLPILEAFECRGKDPLVFATVNVNKTRAHTGERIVLTYDIFTQKDIRYEGFEKEGRFKWFWLDDTYFADNSAKKAMVMYGTRKYVKAPVRRKSIFPILPGQHNIEPGVLKVFINSSYQYKKDPVEDYLVCESIPLSIEGRPAIPKYNPPAEILKKLKASSPQASEAFGKADWIILLDASGSMWAEDFLPNRMVAAQDALEKWIKTEPEVRMGAKVFAVEVFTVAPLMKPGNELIDSIRNQDGGKTVGGSTFMGNAIYEAIVELQNSSQNQKHILILTDGSPDNGGFLEIETAAEFAKEAGIKIHAVAVSSGKEKVPYPVYDEKTKKFSKIDTPIQWDDAGLKEITRITGGSYFHVKNQEELNRVFLNFQMP